MDKLSSSSPTAPARVFPIVIDWFLVLSGLSKAGIRSRQLSQITGLSESAIKGFKRGISPRWEYGQMIIDVWRQNVGGELPVISQNDWLKNHYAGYIKLHQRLIRQANRRDSAC